MRQAGEEEENGLCRSSPNSGNLSLLRTTCLAPKTTDLEQIIVGSDALRSSYSKDPRV